MSVTALREMVMLPENRPAMRLLLRSTMAMASVPIAVYYFFFHQVLGPQGWYDMSDDLNWRINYSGFASLAAVQVRRAALSSVPSCLLASLSHARARGEGVPFVRLTAVVGWIYYQVVIGCHVVAAFRQDDADAAREAEIKAELKAARAARCVVRSGLRARVCLYATVRR